MTLSRALTIALAVLLLQAPALRAPDQALAQDSVSMEEFEAVSGRWIMLLDEVTCLVLNEDGTFLYEDPMETFSAHYAVDQDQNAVVCDFTAFDWYFGENLRCEPVDNATLSCSDGERYRREEAMPPERISGKYVREDDPEMSLSLQRDMEYFYATPDGICTYRYEVVEDKVHVFVWDCEALGTETLVCTPGDGCLACSNNATYVRR